MARPGSDVTVVTYGTAVSTCAQAADALAAEDIEVDLIDLRSIQPWDVETVVASVRRSHRALVVHDATRTFGAGGEIASEISERCFGALAAPVRRLGGARRDLYRPCLG